MSREKEREREKRRERGRSSRSSKSAMVGSEVGWRDEVADRARSRAVDRSVEAVVGRRAGAGAFLTAALGKEKEGMEVKAICNFTCSGCVVLACRVVVLTWRVDCVGGGVSMVMKAMRGLWCGVVWCFVWAEAMKW